VLLVEYESAILEEDIDHASAVVVNLFFSSHVQNFSGVASAAPEGDIFAVFLFQSGRIHIGC